MLHHKPTSLGLLPLIALLADGFLGNQILCDFGPESVLGWLPSFVPDRWTDGVSVWSASDGYREIFFRVAPMDA